LLYLGDKKMSKSDGNFFAMGDVLEKFDPEVIRFFLLNAHFRSQLDYGDDRLQEAEAALGRLRRGARRLVKVMDSGIKPVPDGLVSEPGEVLRKAVREQHRRFFQAMDDDFNSGGALGALFGLVKELNQYFSIADDKVLDQSVLEEAQTLFKTGVEILGLYEGGFTEFAADDASDIPAEILELARNRDKARSRKAWAEADGLRDEIEGQGYRIEDSAQGTIVRKN
jgi:cysteinyl-tRNA synthetase